jgi:hypothetical protein
MKPKPSDAEILRIALEPDIELEYERVLRMTDEEICKSLEARGHDLRVLEAEADIMWAQMRPHRMHRGHLAGVLALVSTSGAAIAAAMGSFTAAAPVFATAAAAPPAVSDVAEQTAAPADGGKP